MKNDLATSIGLTIVGAVIAYFVCNLFIPPIEDFTFKSLTTKTDASLVNPNPEVFNYRAINPTVEVYVGDCTNVGPGGECLDGRSD